MLHYDDIINDVNLIIYNIEAEIAKSLMRLYVVCPKPNPGSIATLHIIPCTLFYVGDHYIKYPLEFVAGLLKLPSIHSQDSDS
jgi:hypothetical protein